jgi:hypothetical protein
MFTYRGLSAQRLSECTVYVHYVYNPGRHSDGCSTGTMLRRTRDSYRCKMTNKCVKELVDLLMYSRFTPACFGKWLSFRGGRRCLTLINPLVPWRISFTTILQNARSNYQDVILSSEFCHQNGDCGHSTPTGCVLFRKLKSTSKEQENSLSNLKAIPKHVLQDCFENLKDIVETAHF